MRLGAPDAPRRILGAAASAENWADFEVRLAGLPAAGI
jgi:hypothetical protein